MKKLFIIAAAAFICAGVFSQEAKTQESVYNEDTVAENVARIGILMKDLDANMADIQKPALQNYLRKAYKTSTKNYSITYGANRMIKRVHIL